LENTSDREKEELNKNIYFRKKIISTLEEVKELAEAN